MIPRFIEDAEMFSWIREIVGWVLVVIAVVLVKVVLDFVNNRQVVEGSITAVLSIGILRGGILLIRMSTAARIANR